jgi:hypothetical protein
MKSTLREGLAPSPTCHTAARWFPRKWDVAVSTASVAEWPALALAGGLDDGANCIFIGATASLLCAPAIVRAASLMPVRRMRVRIAPQYAGFCERLMYQSLDSNWRADEMSTILNGKIIPEDNARRMVALRGYKDGLRQRRPRDSVPQRHRYCLISYIGSGPLSHYNAAMIQVA